MCTRARSTFPAPSRSENAHTVRKLFGALFVLNIAMLGWDIAKFLGKLSTQILALFAELSMKYVISRQDFRVIFNFVGISENPR